MLSTSQIEFYRENGYVVVPDVIGPDVLAKARAKLAELIEKSRDISASDAVYDLEDAHTPRNPRVRRIKDPHINGEIYAKMLKSPEIMDLVVQLIGPDLRMDHTKLNIKPARGGEPVEWHQDWAFSPHTNDDILEVCVMIEDCTLENGPMLMIPGSHQGPVYDHHYQGYFAGAMDPAAAGLDVANAAPIIGKAGAISLHHVRTVHGSRANLSNRDRPMAAALRWVKGPGNLQCPDGAGRAALAAPAARRAGAHAVPAVASSRLDLREPEARAGPFVRGGD